MDILLEYLNEIETQLSKENENEIKILNYIKTLKTSIQEKKYNELLELEKKLHQERKSIKIILRNNFPLFIKYDNIYLEMIRITRQLIKKESL